MIKNTEQDYLFKKMHVYMKAKQSHSELRQGDAVDLVWDSFRRHKGGCSPPLHH